MRVIHLEDNAMKHAAIQRTLNRAGVTDLTWVKNLEDGIEVIKEAMEDGNPFDLAITDMHYPLSYGEEPDWGAGEHFIEIIRKKNITLPIIVCSSINEKIPDIYGNVWYSETRDWETELITFLRQLDSSN